MEFEFCKVEIFVPKTHLKAIQEALHSVDAGHIGEYDSCLSYSEVTGCWRPLEGSRPFLGKEGQVCSAAEYRVEVLCRTKQVDALLQSVKSVHPYEVPVINVMPLYRTGL